jgi:hypothetical protein
MHFRAGRGSSRVTMVPSALLPQRDGTIAGHPTLYFFTFTGPKAGGGTRCFVAAS